LEVEKDHIQMSRIRTALLSTLPIILLLIAAQAYADYGVWALPRAIGLTYTTHGLPDRQVTIVIEQYGEMFVASCSNDAGAAYANDPATAARDLLTLHPSCGE
jgi:hypothetical protein